MRDIVEEVLSTGEGTPPGEVQSVRVAVVGVGTAGAGRLAGVGRRLRHDAVVGQVPWDIDAVVVDLPGDGTTPTDWEPAARHTVERLDRADRGDRVELTPEETDRMRRFAGDRLAPYDAVVLTLDGTDRTAVPVGCDLAAAFRGGIAEPVVAVATFPAEDPPSRLAGAEGGWLPDTRSRFGPDAVVPIEHGRVTELVPERTSDANGPGASRDPVEAVATDVTAALAEALGTRTQFGSLADDIHRLRGRVQVHVGRQPGPHEIDDSALVADALATPLAGIPADWRRSGTWLGHLRTHSAEDEAADAVMERISALLTERTGIDPCNRPAALRSYRLTETGVHELFLLRVEGTDEPDGDPVPQVEAEEDMAAAVAEALESEDWADERESDDDYGGLDVIR
jgi:hypothetical protein